MLVFKTSKLSVEKKKLFEPLECSVVQEQYINGNLRELFGYVIAIQLLSMVENLRRNKAKIEETEEH